VLSSTVTAELHEQIVHARLVREDDLAGGWGEVWLPDAIARRIPVRCSRRTLAVGSFRQRDAGETGTVERADITAMRHSSSAP
jgi:hypothetical protein